jgi:hypothetical protein
VDELHREEEHAVALAELFDVDDVRMDDACGERRASSRNMSTNERSAARCACTTLMPIGRVNPAGPTRRAR